MTGIYLPSFVLDENKVKNVILAPDLQMNSIGDNWLGGFINDDVIEAQFELSSSQTPVPGFTTDNLDIWIHNWDQEQSNWWDNPVENEYHERLDVGEFTFTEPQPGEYTISYILDTSKPIFSSGGHFGMEVKAGNAGMHFNFEVLTGEVYTVSGTVTDIAGTPIEGVYVDLWGPTGGGHTETDENGDYQMRITAGIWEFGTWYDASQTGTYTPGLSITSDLVRDVVLAPQLNLFSDGMNFLGAYIDGDTVTAQVSVESAGSPVIGLPSNIFDVWLHNWQEDMSNWWDNPVENQYHAQLASGELGVVDNLDGTYDLSFTVNTATDWHTYGMFQDGGNFEFDIRAGDQGAFFHFDVLTGDVYTISGTVRNVAGAPVEGAYVDLWTFSSGGGHTETNAQGQYSMVVTGGTWEFGVYDDASMTGYYEAGLIIDQNIVKDVTILPQLDAMPIGDPFLGFVKDGDVLTAEWELYEGQTPYTGFDTSILTVWVHSQADPTMQNQNPSDDWFKTRLPNEYHSDITPQATITELGNGEYRVVYTVDISDPVLALGGGFDLEVEIAGEGVHWPFGIITGDVYTVSGTVSDLGGNPVQNVHVSVWDEGFWFDDQTDAQGQYSIMCPAGTYDFGVDPDPESGYFPYYEPGLVVDGDVTGHDVVITGEGGPPVQGFTMTGTVTDGTFAVTDAEVEFFAEPNGYTGMTDEFGDYSIVVPGGMYELLVFTPDDQTLSGYMVPSVNVIADDVIDIALTPIPPGSPVLSGTVYAPDGTTPVDEADVVLIAGTAMYETMSQPNGQYAITCPVGTYDQLICFSPSQTPYDDYFDPTIGLIDSSRVEDITLTEGGGGPPQ